MNGRRVKHCSETKNWITGKSPKVDECQRSVEDLVILQAESAELHQNIAKLSEHEQFIIKSIYFEGMKQVELAKILGISKVRMSQKVSAILKKMRKMYEMG